MSDHKQISNLLHNSSINLSSLKNYIQFEEQVQKKELKNLRQQLLQNPKVISDSSTLPSYHTSNNNNNKKHTDNTNEKSFNKSNYPVSNMISPDDNDDSFSLSSSSSSTSSDDKHNLSNKLRKLFKIKNNLKSTSNSKPILRHTFAKKAISLATKMIKNASRVQFRKLKTDNDPCSTRLLFMYFIKDLTNLLDLFTETQVILLNYPTISEPKTKHA